MYMSKQLLVGACVAIAFVFSAFAYAPSASAAGRFGDNNTNYIKAGETVDGAVYLAGDAVHIEGTVNGDVNCAAQTVVITGMVNGDVNCAGLAVTVGGKVTGDVRVAGESVTISGEIAGSATAFGQTITVETAARIGRDAVLGGSEVLVNGAIGRDVVATAQTATLNGPVVRDVEGAYEDLTIGNDAAIGGFLHYTSDNGAQISGKINGDVKREERSQYTGRQADVIQSTVTSMIVLLAWLALMALALQLIFPKKIHTATSLTPQGAVLATALGLVSLITIPIIAVTLMVSVIALPLGVALLLAWLALCAMSAGVTAIYLGRVLLKKINIHPVARSVMAALGLGVIFMIPLINILAIVGSLAFGTGAVLYALRGEQKTDNKGPRVKLVKAA